MDSEAFLWMDYSHGFSNILMDCLGSSRIVMDPHGFSLVLMGFMDSNGFLLSSGTPMQLQHFSFPLISAPNHSRHLLHVLVGSNRFWWSALKLFNLSALPVPYHGRFKDTCERPHVAKLRYRDGSRSEEKSAPNATFSWSRIIVPAEL